MFYRHKQVYTYICSINFRLMMCLWFLLFCLILVTEPFHQATLYTSIACNILILRWDYDFWDQSHWHLSWRFRAQNKGCSVPLGWMLFLNVSVLLGDCLFFFFSFYWMVSLTFMLTSKSLMNPSNDSKKCN